MPTDADGAPDRARHRRACDNSEPSGGDRRHDLGEGGATTRQPPHALAGAMALDEAVESGAGKLLDELAEYSVVMRHGVGPTHVQLGGKRLNPSRISVLEFVQQNRPDSRGHDRCVE
jgi:hypothetical protein